MAREAFTESRDRHLFGPGPKRILALDGGGVRGAISTAFLERVEELLRERHGPEVRLADHFDLIGGTSTGAIIAGALALGYGTADLKHFYFRLAPLVFRKPWWRMMYWHAKFDAKALRREIESVVGERTLESEDLRTGLALVAKRIDTGSPWLLINNPRAPFWNDPADKSYVGNRHYRLSNLVRASTAAPVYFDPEVLEIIQGEPHGLFIDGGISPYNNPALALLMLTQLKPFGLEWSTGPDKLLVVSVGTGSFRTRLSSLQARKMLAFRLAIHALAGIITDSQNQALALLQWLGECPQPWAVDSEIGTLAADTPAGGPLFKFVRYDVQLERAWLKDVLGITIGDKELDLLRAMDNPASIRLGYEIGRRAAADQVKLEHLDVAGTQSRPKPEKRMQGALGCSTHSSPIRAKTSSLPTPFVPNWNRWAFAAGSRRAT